MTVVFTCGEIIRLPWDIQTSIPSPLSHFLIYAWAKKIDLNYWSVPTKSLEKQELLIDWVNRAFVYSERLTIKREVGDGSDT